MNSTPGLRNFFLADPSREKKIKFSRAADPSRENKILFSRAADLGRPRPGLSDFSKSILNQAVLEAYLELRTHIQDSWRTLQVLEALQFTRQSQQQPARDRAASGRRKSGSKSARKKYFSREKKYFSRGPRIQVGENFFSRVFGIQVGERKKFSPTWG